MRRNISRRGFHASQVGTTRRDALLLRPNDKKVAMRTGRREGEGAPRDVRTSRVVEGAGEAG
jgi:hypothetical protein